MKMDLRQVSSKWPGNHHRQLAVLVLLNLLISQGFSDIFCPSAVLNDSYTITAENYNVSRSQGSLEIALSFNEQQIMVCDLTINNCSAYSAVFIARGLSLNNMNIGVAGVQIKIKIANFTSDLQGSYTISWQISGSSSPVVLDSCMIAAGGPVDECTSDPCLNSANCTNLQIGYSCNCLQGYNGMNCKEGDMKLYCSLNTLDVEFPQQIDVCGTKNITCFVAGLDSQEDPGITYTEDITSSSPDLTVRVTVFDEIVNFTVCTTAAIIPGNYRIVYRLESPRASASFNFEILANVKDENAAPRFNTPGYDLNYLISLSETTQPFNIVAYVNKSTTQSCFRENGCIQVIDSDQDQDKGINSLFLIATQRNEVTPSINFQNSPTNDSFGYFFVNQKLIPETQILWILQVTDGQQASATATVTFTITAGSQSVVCNESAISVDLDIRVQPLFIIGAVSCTGDNINDPVRRVQYNVVGQNTSYFSVTEVGTIFVNRSLLDLQPGLLNFFVQVTDTSPNPDGTDYNIPVHVNITVPTPNCNMAVTSAPKKWEINSTVELRLQCDTSGLDRLSITPLISLDLFNVSFIKENSTVFRVTLQVLRYFAAKYNLVIAATLGGSESLVSTSLRMYNPPQFYPPTFYLPELYMNEIMETASVGATLLNLNAITDIPNATLSISIKSGDPDSVFVLYSYQSSGNLHLAKSLKPYVGSEFRIDFEAKDSISELTSDYLWNVTVRDVNESPLCFSISYNVTELSNLPPGGIIVNILCQDPDITPEYKNLTYIMNTEPPAVLLDINSYGTISLLEVFPVGVSLVRVSINVTDMTYTVPVMLYINVIVVYCPLEMTQNGIIFPETPVNSMATVNCSSLYSGEVSRFCYLNQTWGLFNFTDCRRKELQYTEKQIEELKTNTGNYTDEVITTKITTFAAELINSLLMSSTILSGDIKQIVKIIYGLGELTLIYKNATVDRKTLENIVKCSDQIIGSDLGIWIEALLGRGEEGALMLEAMDTLVNASMRFDVLDNEPPVVMENIAIKIAGEEDDILFPDASELAYQLFGGWVLKSGNTAHLSKEAHSNSLGRTKYSVIMYHNATRKLISNPNVQNDTFLENKVLNSDIISVTVNPGIIVLSPPLLLSLSVHQTKFSNASCGYLNTRASEAGVWSSEGCTATKQGDMIRCSCNHLTNFALLMSPYGEVSDTDETILSLISAVGCGISIFCLVITIIVYAVLWKYVKGDRSVLHMNLSACLILAYILFLAGVDRTDNVIACKVVAALLHYIYLVVFCIILSEGIEIFKSVSFVFSSNSILCKLIPFSYGVPLLIVAISLGVTKTEGYGSATSCWLSTNNGLIWAFVGPVLLILLVNFIIVIQVLRIMQNTKQMMNKTVQQRTKSVIRTICFLSPLLGLTWVFGVLSVNRDLVVFQYLFAIFNSLQGLAIFICYCLLAHQVHDGFRAMRRKHRAQSIDHPNTYSNTPEHKNSSSDTHYGRSPLTKSPHISSNSRNQTLTNQTTRTNISDSGYSSSQGQSTTNPTSHRNDHIHGVHLQETSFEHQTAIPHESIAYHTGNGNIYDGSSQQTTLLRRPFIFPERTESSVQSMRSGNGQIYDGHPEHSSYGRQTPIPEDNVYSESMVYPMGGRNRHAFDNISQGSSLAHRTFMPMAFVNPGRENTNMTFDMLSTSYKSYSDNSVGSAKGRTNYGYHDNKSEDSFSS